MKAERGSGVEKGEGWRRKDEGRNDEGRMGTGEESGDRSQETGSRRHGTQGVKPLTHHSNV